MTPWDWTSPRKGWLPAFSCLVPLPLHHVSAILATVVLLLCEPSYTQRDPVNNFCRRFGHQTAFIDRKLYIDGGLMNWNPMSTDPSNHTNTWLLYQDLDAPGDDGMPQLYANLSKNASIPSVSGGILWADDVNKKFYLFGGEYHVDPPEDLVLYAYDILGNNWESLGNPPDFIDAVSYGAGVSIPSTGEAYYYGGWLSNRSMPGWSGPRLATNSLIRYAFDSLAWTNTSGPDSIGRSEGSMVYIPAGNGGMLVYLGGLQDGGDGNIVGQPMEQVFIYDISSDTWYRQTATGDVPEVRSRFCAGVAWSKDQSSYNIYIYGGSELYGPGFDDVYILSLPSFAWAKYWSNGAKPHNTLSCNVIDGAQMFIIGGTFPLDNISCDAPQQYGSHNLDLGAPSSQGAQWGLYDPQLTDYDVPPDVIKMIGGDSAGAATKLAPDGGFVDPVLSGYFGRKFTPTARTPTLSLASATGQAQGSGYNNIETSVLAGVVVGCVVALVVMAAICVWLLRRRKRRGRHACRSTTYSRDPSMSSWGCHRIITCNGDNNDDTHGRDSWSPHGCSPHSSRQEPNSPYTTSPCCASPPHTHTLRRCHSHPRTRAPSYQRTAAPPSLRVQANTLEHDLYNHFQRQQRQQQQQQQQRNREQHRQDRQQYTGPSELDAGTVVGSPQDEGLGLNGMDVSPQSKVGRTMTVSSPSCTMPSHVSFEDRRRGRYPPPKYYDDFASSETMWAGIENRGRSYSVTNTCDTCLGTMQRARRESAVREIVEEGVIGSPSHQKEEDEMPRPKRRRFSFESPESPVDVRRRSWGNGIDSSSSRYVGAGFGPCELSAETATPRVKYEVRHDTFYHP